MKKLSISLLSFLFVYVLSFAQNEPDYSNIVKSADEYAQKVVKEWQIPGVSFSIIKDGKLLLTKGYGVSEKGGDNPVDENTIYHIGSISKSFTAAVMASVVDEGLVSWDDTVKNILPDFDLYDDWVENNMLVKDLMTHKTGIRGQAGTYIPNLGYDREDIYQMMKLIKPEYSFRNVYAYNNITFIIASKVIEKVTGKSWEENIQTRILDPLGMTNTYINEEGYLAAGNRASVAHDFWYVKDSMYVAPIHGEERALHWLTVVGPAGSISSNVVDMSKWAQFHLDNGKVGDQQVISQRQMNFLHRGQTIVSQDSSYIRLYAHCWFKEQNNRYKLYFHTGTTWGFTAICAFVPELNLGMVILCNSEAPSDPRYSIMRRTIDLFMGDQSCGEMKDWSADYLDAWWKDEREAYMKKEAKESNKVFVDPPKSKVLVGKYTKEAPFADAKVTLENEELYITIGKYNWKHKLTHVSGNEYSFRSDGHAFPITFELNKRGNKALSFTIDFGYDENFGPWINKR